MLNLWRSWQAIDFQVPIRPFCCSVQIKLNLYTWLPLLPNLLLFYRRFHVFLTVAICIYICFAEKVVFRFLAFGFISHTTRISNKTSFLCKRLVVKKKLRNNLSRFTNLKCFFTGRLKPEDLTSKLSQILAKICCLKLDLNWS